MGADHGLDKWASWLLHRRDGNDPAQRRKSLEYLLPIRDRVLDGARLGVGETVLDVGAGDGLVAFGALDRIGPTGHVIASDVSIDLLERARGIARATDAVSRMSFVRAGAEDLRPVPDASVDAVTTRSVLIYVPDKAKAFAEFFRVLRAGGRVSVAEPINKLLPRRRGRVLGLRRSARA